MITSERLTPGEVYTRAQLKELFQITDATINTGVFRPKGTSSVWLFVTEKKTSDRTPYRDHLEGETLHWQGQTSGRTDAWIIDHRASELELLVFFRKQKYEHSGAGFRYLGPFAYVSHSGANPISFVLRAERARQAAIGPDTADDEPFDPSTVEDGRTHIMRSIAHRRGQKAFREQLLFAYGGRCAITGCSIREILEAAHIYPYRGPDTNKVENGLLLRADLHTLFDCGLVAIDGASMTVVVAPVLRESEYAELHGSQLRLPDRDGDRPNQEAVRLHREAAGI